MLAFIPRAAAIFVVFALTFPWMLRVLTGFARRADHAAAGARPLMDLSPSSRFGCCWCGPALLVMAAPVFGGDIRAGAGRRSA